MKGIFCFLLLIVGCSLALPTSDKLNNSLTLSTTTMKATILKFLDSPLSKQLTDPKALEEFRNSDADGGDSFRGQLQNLGTELVTNYAERVNNPQGLLPIPVPPAPWLWSWKWSTRDVITRFLNSDALVNVIDPIKLRWALEKSEPLRSWLSSKGVGGFMDTRAYKALVRYDFIHEVVYSEMGKNLLNAELSMKNLNNPYIAAMLTPENVKDFLESPAISQNYKLEISKKRMDSLVLKKMAKMDIIKAYLNTSSIKSTSTPEMRDMNLNSDIVVELIRPENFHWFLNYTWEKGYNKADGLPRIMKTRAFPAIVNYDFIKLFVHHPLGVAMMAPDEDVTLLNSQEIADQVTPENIKDFLASPAIKITKMSIKRLNKTLHSKVITKLFSRDVYDAWKPDTTNEHNKELWQVLIHSPVGALFWDLLKSLPSKILEEIGNVIESFLKGAYEFLTGWIP